MVRKLRLYQIKKIAKITNFKDENLFQPNVWNTLNMEDKRKVHFSKMVPKTEQKTGNKAKHDSLSPSPELKSVERQIKKKHINPSLSKSPSPEKMGVRKRQGGVTPDHERKDTLSPVKIKVRPSLSRQLKANAVDVIYTNVYIRRRLLMKRCLNYLYKYDKNVASLS